MGEQRLNSSSLPEIKALFLTVEQNRNNLKMI